eukprot:m.986542 g.986542  ORF g.986542 m.986542 type:complete len:53 (+) comp23990_c0_seq5:907-1065(+)
MHFVLFVTVLLLRHHVQSILSNQITVFSVSISLSLFLSRMIACSSHVECPRW